MNGGTPIRPIHMHEENGHVIVDEYPPLIGVTDFVLMSADRRRLVQTGEWLIFRADNLSARYRIVGRNECERLTLAERAVPA